MNTAIKHRIVRGLEWFFSLAQMRLLSICACVCAMGCSISSRPMPAIGANSLDLKDGPATLINPVPSDASKSKVAVFVAAVQCNATITGRPLELARRVRGYVIQYMTSSDNFTVLNTCSDVCFEIEMSVSSFERGIDTRSDERAFDLVVESARDQERRKGILELEVAVTDLVSTKLLFSFSVNAQTEDITFTKSIGLLGYTSVGEGYQRTADDALVSEAARKVAVELWARLIGSEKSNSNLNIQ
jgi:hypothetical protein